MAQSAKKFYEIHVPSSRLSPDPWATYNVVGPPCCHFVHPEIPLPKDAVSLYNLVGNICNYQTHTPAALTCLYMFLLTFFHGVVLPLCDSCYQASNAQLGLVGSCDITRLATLSQRLLASHDPRHSIYIDPRSTTPTDRKS